ncbi:choline transporter-like protein 2 isoform X3 [Macaca nemestrina]|uniref:Choline transporter-like protein n=2 Tax=Macaca TaxID=9539 RepID=A0A5K1UNU9_MACMU|nr:choline transporter-like protein 2 isoform X3 [Macaca nemestrina]XP_011949175.1 PREDICTED: choline transporter-like protein 2 isoform X3 [Cercocebus atys]XP_014978359.1 choline transporter-like protein 2 isoform X3 [Macaca mulatta]XP_031515779.1 choline transporter-like protein 2 isoform X3 [Papio anubis]XP_045234412.1 choline transporter-like protein 2 isoform X3 [Macaca fascicularis]XP_050626187.1 choline transporter-like protein 2 isoform X2 [Macaca thibetana thibetana]EHH29631.1 Solute
MGDERPHYYGKHGTPQKYDPTFKGPIYNRGCTDVICCVFLLLAIVGYVAVGIIAWTHGDPRKVIYPTDSRGEFCGQKGTKNENKPYLFYFNIVKCASPLVLLEFQCPTPQICVEKCPDRYLTYLNARSSRDFEYYKQFCVPGFKDNKGVAEVLRDGDCPAVLIPSKPLARRCFPAIHAHKGVLMVGNETTYEDGHGSRKNITDLVEGAKKANGVLEARQLAMRIFEDYTVSWYWIIIGLVIAMAMSLLFIILLRFLAGIMVWVMIIMVILVLGYGIFHCYMEYSRLRGEAGSDVSLVDLGFQTDFRVYLHLRQTWLAFMIILSILEVIIILLLIFLRKRILIAIALIKEASRAVGYVMCSLLYPLVTFFLLCLCIAYWASTAVFLSTSNEAVYKIFDDSSCSLTAKTCNPETFPSSNESRLCPNARCQFAFYGGESGYHRALLGLQIFNAFMFFWLANFVLALGQVTLAGAFASYYWALRKPDDLPAFPLFSAFGRALRYHTGSLAFGALILAIVQIIRVILEYLDQRLKAAENKFAKCLMTCLKCCFWCLEKFIKFLNRNAYIMIAIYGTNFCTSARNAFFLLMRNIIRVAVLDKVTDFLFLLGKLLIVGSVGILAFFFFTHRIRIVQDTAPPLNYYWVPILTVIVGSYLIAHGFFSVYGMCVDTLFLCFLEDLERNDGSAERPYFMSSTLKKLLNKTNKKAAES